LATAGLSGTSWCAGTDSGYLLPTGWALAQFAGLSGSYVGATVSGAPSVTNYPVSVQPQTPGTGVVAVASIDTSVSPAQLSVVLINLGPPAATQQCGGSNQVPIPLSLGSGSAITSVSATTVTASDAYADNTDTAQTLVSAQPLQPAPVLSGGVVSLTL